jgi:hypothetical protein
LNLVLKLLTINITAISIIVYYVNIFINILTLQVKL